MRYPLEPVDSDNNHLHINDEVILVHASENLLRDLPDDDQRNIIAQVGNVVNIHNIDDDGFVELIYETTDTDQHTTDYVTIWVEPRFLRRIL